jgi:predicted permease
MAFLRRLIALFRRRRLERDLDDELGFHLAMRQEEQVRGGIAADNADVTARRQFGNVTLIKESTRDLWTFGWIERFVQDLRLAARTLRRSFGFSTLAVLTLAVGIGATTAIFSVVNGVILSPLSYPDSERLVRTTEYIAGSNTIDGVPRRSLGLDALDILEWQRTTQTLAHLGAYDRLTPLTMSHAGEPLRVAGSRVTPSLFTVLGIDAALGRTFTPDEEHARTVVLSHRLWRTVFGADTAIVDRTVVFDAAAHTVIGVMPPGFEFPEPATEFWLPLSLEPDRPDLTSVYFTIGRLKAGMEPQAAAAEANSLLQGRRRYGFDPPPDRPQFEVIRAKDELVAPVRTGLFVLLSGVGFLLLTACSNVANLLLARCASRRGELALRAALGASRTRLVAQMLIESSMLAALGGLAGVWIALGGVSLLQQFGPVDLPRLREIGVDRTVLLFTAGMSFVTGVLFGSAPARQVFRTDPITDVRRMREHNGSRWRAGRQGFVIAQVALAVVLLVGGGLLVRSFINVASVDPGFSPENLLTFKVARPRAPGQPVPEPVVAEFRERLAALPHVRSMAFASSLPFLRGFTSIPRVRGIPEPIAGIADVRFVSRSYVQTMGLRLLAGRDFGESDLPGHPMAVLINQTLAAAFPDETPIEQPLTLATTPAIIVGVVNDTRESGLDAPVRPLVYVDARQGLLRLREQYATDWATFAVRTEGDPSLLLPSVRALVRETIPGATLEMNAGRLTDVIGESMARRRFYALLFGTFALVAALLAGTGVYGVMAHAVAERTKEIGIRMALGACTGAVLALVVRQGGVAVAVGMIVGTIGALSATRYLESLLFGLSRLDPATFVVALALLAAVALIAAVIPARRATSVDPLVALRCE